MIDKMYHDQLHSFSLIFGSSLWLHWAPQNWINHNFHQKDAYSRLDMQSCCLLLLFDWLC